jgi:hypothetical protein
MEPRFQDHLERIDRLIRLMRSYDAASSLAGVETLTYYDLAIMACEAMWLLKERLLNDAAFHARSTDELREDIHREWCLLVCADVAHGRANLVLARPPGLAAGRRESGDVRQQTRDIGGARFYLSTSNPRDPYHGMELDELLRQCRDAWRRIIDRHWLSGLPF